MNPNLPTVAAWSYGLAGVGYTAFALYLGFGWRGGIRGLALTAAVGADGGVGAGGSGVRGDASQRVVRDRRPGRRAAHRRLVLFPVARLARRSANAGDTANSPRPGVARAGRVRSGGGGRCRAACGGAAPRRLRRPAAARDLRRHRAQRLRPRPGRAALPQHTGRRALEHQAAMPRPGRSVRLRPLSLRRRAAVQPRRRGCVERARSRARARHSVPRIVDDAQSRLDVRHRLVAARGLPLDGADRFGRLPAVHGGRGLLRPLFRRQLGTRAPGRGDFRGLAHAGGDGVLGLDSREAPRDRQQAFLQLPLRLSRRVAALHAGAVGARGAAGARGGRHQGARGHAGEPGGKPLAPRFDGPAFRAGRALEHAGRRGGGARRLGVPAVSERDRLGRESRGIPVVAGALSQAAPSALAVGVAERVARHSARRARAN